MTPENKGTMKNKNADQPAFAAINELGGMWQPGLTKREYFAGIDWGVPPETLYRIKLREFNEAKKITRKTDGSPIDVMTADEIAVVRACWKIKCADEILKQLNP